MSSNDRSPLSHSVAKLSARQLKTYRRAACRPDIRLQVDRLLDDIGRLRLPRGDGDPPLPAGAALALAQTSLELAITAPADDDDRALKTDALRGIILPALDAVGFGHVTNLVEAALAIETDVSAVLQRSYARH